MADEDLRPQSRLRISRDGIEMTRRLFLRAADEAEVLVHADLPARGDVVDVGYGSLTRNLYCQSVDIDEQPTSRDDGTGRIWEVTATYAPLTGRNAAPVVNKAKWRMGYRPQSIHVTHVKDEADQTHYEPYAPEEHGEVKTAVGVTSEGIAGVDIDEMTKVLTIDFWKDPDDLEAFLTALDAIANTVNDDGIVGPWGTIPAGYGRLTGISVGNDSEDIVTVSLEISIAKSETLDVYLDVGDDTVEVVKGGHEYLWVRSIKSVDPADDTTIRIRAIDAHVAKFYEEADWSSAGISASIFV